ncbi:MAG: hypothetical protein ACYCYR_03655 [Desulfobulbaceae bacterium]|jgi:hypothetical protein
MTGELQPRQYFIGWDVGGWNCDKNNRSRDAIVILDSKLDVAGTPWRGNLRDAINEAKTSRDWLRRLFSLCKIDLPSEPLRAILAIDTPLGFSEPFIRLTTRLKGVEGIGQSHTNPYLFRQTERFLFEHGHKPLSAVKDMIGSQATKGMHVLAKFAPKVVRCGVWTDGDLLTVIEAYPSACKKSKILTAAGSRYESLGHEDKDHALTCALIAHLFSEKFELLSHPGDNVPRSEGWIWVPKDGLQNNIITGQPR